MSDADDAFDRWIDDTSGFLCNTDRLSYKAGYRQALLDLRDSVHASVPAQTILMHPPLVSVLKRMTVLAQEGTDDE
jgi:hypothetical protein